MAESWQRMGWHEAVFERCWSMTYQQRESWGGCMLVVLAITATVSALLAFVLGPPNQGSGVVGTLGTLLMAAPVLVLGASSVWLLWSDQQRRVTIRFRAGQDLRIDRGYGGRSIPLGEIASFEIDGRHLVARSHNGKSLDYLFELAPAARFVLPRLESALAWSKAPRGARF